MDPLVLFTALALAGLAATATIAVHRTLNRSASTERFEEALAKITGAEVIESMDTSLAKSSKKFTFSWTDYWIQAFEKSGRKVQDRSAPGRIMLGVVILSAVFGVFVMPDISFAGLVPVVAMASVLLWLSFERSRRMAGLERQLPLLLSSLRNQMQAGMTVQAAIMSVADDLPAPLGDEMRQVKNDVSVSIPLDQSLSALAARSESRLMTFLVASIGIATRSGADLIPQLIVIEEVVRQRARITGKIRSAIALAKPTAYLAMGAPVAMGGWLFITDPTYSAYFFGPDGILMFLGILAFYAAGVVTVQIMVKGVEKV